MQDQYAFVSEYGNYDFDFTKEGVSTHFIVTAIIVDGNKLEGVRGQVESIRQKYFPTGEISSIKVSEDDEQRLLILKSLASVDFHIFSMVVDKKKLNLEGGLGYKRSFHKYLNGRVHDELYTTFSNLKLVARQHESKEFMEGFVAYVNKKHIPNLFSQAEFGFVDSKDELLIQVADFIGATLAKHFEEKTLSAKEKTSSSSYEDFWGLISNKIIGLREWPNQFQDFMADIKTQGIFNDIIARQSVALALQYISSNEGSMAPFVRDQANFLRFLLLNLRIEPNKYVSTMEIIKNLSKLRGRSLTPYYLRSRIVGKLRDEGLLIASSDKGYKLPVSEADLFDFVNHSNLIVQPMLLRLEKCRNQILLATKNGLDILDRPEYERLGRFFREE
ncbi:DUF3800 domain-containing protein [Desulfosporosinus sp. PR]|uniref:DUF3800 domain-containing protein n=1 Tax=Candidatus Desulfosporosinus nitrosoreducens TaxID=3401928 RepID=UPI0027F15512|nr:DUF3800 domain-containing protein [Desulfosporosinus sp. PR]MDQ7094574.1 DUF3800 domain-containing protein [Desulfosporosinus sp. PR]